ncbi:hypothetical protein J7T55_000125 [Diaporthe amygdali]|uniref:uncharacterized protein n=1 Tax=Phomopsis amygdali TaxID=1214568 RepID=UPI0022FF07C9|nr:uncharacterized protein J7T55_000125 [Diaporthe amygdali]KAJ0108160.1 hypothetical protein J7T55_000125 [Diaporthe amygdali]
MMSESNSQERPSSNLCCCRERPTITAIDEALWEQTVESYRIRRDHTSNPPRNASVGAQQNIRNNTAEPTNTVRDNDRECNGGIDNRREGTPGFINLVINRGWNGPRWLHRLRKGRKSYDEGCEYGFCLNLADVQRMHMRLLQARVTWLALSAGFDNDHGISKGVLSDLGPALHDYVQAVHDHEYMGRFAGQRHDPFRVSSERFQEKILLDRVAIRLGKTVADFTHLQPEALATGPWEDGESVMRPIGGTRGETFRRALWSRIASTLVGAAFLIGPMWLLVLNQNLYLQLGVTTGCVVMFGLVMVAALETLEAVFAATLAYAAVLMVFVGVVMDGLKADS